ncbi:MAG: IS110 family transposase [Desulfobacteraceae bacterium]|nr:MAG: IS110 family transposase [Desulfobacteraceae bacterium]
MKKNILYVGLDVHKFTIDIAIAGNRSNSQARSYGQIDNRFSVLDRVVRKLQSKGSELQFVYEAGPCGYQLYRHLTAKGHVCSIVAPSLIPRRPGDRIKTDRRDAINLVRLFQAGELNSICIPSEEDEAMRDLLCCRDDIRRLERKARQRLLAFLLRNRHRYSDTKHWTKAHMKWLADIKFAHPAQQIVFQEYLDAVNECTERVERITGQVRSQAAGWSRAPFVQAYQALRGVSLIVATTVVAEVGDMSRFKNPKELMAYLGLVPSEHSSGKTIRRGPITKTGNGHVRRVLVEAAWSYKTVPRKSQTLLKRQQGLPKSICDISWKAQMRLCTRYWRLLMKGKAKQTIITAIARELGAFIWAIDKEVKGVTV